jgi:hypothetical protein
MPDGGFFDTQLGEFLLPYDQVRLAQDPERLVLDFFQRSYDAAAGLGHWEPALAQESVYMKELRERERARRKTAA